MPPITGATTPRFVKLRYRLRQREIFWSSWSSFRYERGVNSAILILPGVVALGIVLSFLLFRMRRLQAGQERRLKLQTAVNMEPADQQ